MDLRAELSKLNRKLNKHNFLHLPKDEPMSFKSDTIRFDGELRKRKRIILLTNGCTVGTCTMCPFPSESSVGVTSQNLINQFDKAFEDDDISGYEIVTIFNNGNMFKDSEIPAEARVHMYNKTRDGGCKYFVTESLPQFYDEVHHKEALDHLGDVRLCVFMGLQSANDFIRNVCINTTCTKGNYEKAVKLLQSADYIPHAFLMLKPPFVTESEGVTDVLESLSYLAGLNVTTVTICPTRVAPGTLLEKLYDMGEYNVPWNWSVVQVLESWNDRAGVIPMVNTSELKAEVNPDSVCAYGCPICHDTTIKKIEEYLYSRDVSILKDISCSCFLDYMDHVREEDKATRWRNRGMKERIEYFLEELKEEGEKVK